MALLLMVLFILEKNNKQTTNCTALYIQFDAQNQSVVDYHSSLHSTSVHQFECSSMHLWSGRLPPGGDNKYGTIGTLSHYCSCSI